MWCLRRVTSWMNCCLSVILEPNSSVGIPWDSLEVRTQMRRKDFLHKKYLLSLADEGARDNFPIKKYIQISEKRSCWKYTGSPYGKSGSATDYYKLWVCLHYQLYIRSPEIWWHRDTGTAVDWLQSLPPRSRVVMQLVSCRFLTAVIRHLLTTHSPGALRIPQPSDLEFLYSMMIH